MRTAALLSLLVIAACSSAANPAAAPTTERTVRVVGGTGGSTQVTTRATMRARVATLEIPIDKVWQALPEAYELFGMSVATNDRAQGIFGNPGFRARRRLGKTAISSYVDCGRAQGTPSADTYEVHFSVLTELIEESSDKTVVSTVVDATARPINFSGESVQCSSLGELENRILNFIRAAARQ